MSKSSFSIPILSFAEFSWDTISPNSNFNLIQHSHSNSLTSVVHYVKFEIAPSFITIAVAMLLVSICIELFQEIISYTTTECKYEWHTILKRFDGAIML
jgi:hypothetical protein